MKIKFSQLRSLISEAMDMRAMTQDAPAPKSHDTVHVVFDETGVQRIIDPVHGIGLVDDSKKWKRDDWRKFIRQYDVNTVVLKGRGKRHSDLEWSSRKLLAVLQKQESEGKVIPIVQGKKVPQKPRERLSGVNA